MNCGKRKKAAAGLFALPVPAAKALEICLAPDAILIWTVEAGSHFEAMTAYYKFMDWGEYTTDQEWDLQPYPEEWSEA